tara:strand:- start:115 stop:231 length:117 start_codon:yes stop_codon:yes gene_type:complete
MTIVADPGKRSATAVFQAMWIMAESAFYALTFGETATH